MAKDWRVVTGSVLIDPGHRIAASGLSATRLLAAGPEGTERSDELREPNNWVVAANAGENKIPGGSYS
jgi:hypothetical protein